MNQPAALQGGGEMGALMRARDWRGTALGPPEAWPASLKTAIRLVLNTRHPMYLMWGPDLLSFYNDAFCASLGPASHPLALGMPSREVWADIWDIVGPQIATVMAGQGAIWLENALVPMTRHGEQARVYWTYSASPIDDETAPAGVGGVLVICTETTETVQQQRRQAILLALSDRIRDLSAPLAIMAAATEALQAELRVARVGYAEVDDVQASYVIPHERTDGRVPPMAGRHRLAGLGRATVARLIAGEMVVSADVETDPLAADGLDGHRSAGTAAIVIVPLIRAGRLRGSLHVCSGKPCQWSQGDLRLIEEVAQRTWAALERARAEEQQFRLLALIEHSEDFIATADPDGRIMYMNAGGRRMIGLDETAELHRLNFSVYVAPSSQTLFRTVVIPTARNEGIWEGPMQFRNLDTGAVIDVHRTTFAIRGPKGEMKGFATVARNVTESKAAEAALAEREALFRATFEQAAIGVAHVAPDGNWLRVNARICGMLGYTRDELLATNFQNITHPDDIAADMAQVRALLDGHVDTYAMEKRYIRKDGSIFWAHLTVSLLRDARGAPINFVSLIEDISVRKSYEAELRDSRARLQAIFDTVPVGLVIAEAPGGRIVTGNRRAEEIFGHPILLSPGVESYGEWVCFHEDGSRVQPPAFPLAQVLAGAESGDLKALYRRGDGAEVWVRFIAAPIRVDGALVGGVVATLDIDRETRAQQALDRIRGDLELRVSEAVQAREAAQARLAHAQRMEALGQLAGGIAHDVNNIVQAVQGGAGLIRRRRGDPEAVDHLARMIEDAARRGASVTRRLLAFARRDELQAETVDPAALLNDLREMLAHTVGADITVRLELARPDPQNLRADKGQLETVLVNLATNARDAMPQGGTLTLSACDEVIPARLGGQDAAALLAPGRYVRLAVSDTGEGMTPAVLARAAEPFFTTKAHGKGTGLGLAMARGFAEQSGGALAIQSAPAAGTTVTLWLPAACTAAAAPGPAAPALAPAPRRILVVDDEALVREVVAQGLGELGFVTFRAADGATALAMLDAGAELDLLLTDHAMPGMDGVTLVREARLRRPDLPAILLTGNADSQVETKLALEGVVSGAFSLMRKPVSAEQLAERMEALLERMSAARHPVVGKG